MELLLDELLEIIEFVSEYQYKGDGSYEKKDSFQQGRFRTIEIKEKCIADYNDSPSIEKLNQLLGQLDKKLEKGYDNPELQIWKLI